MMRKSRIIALVVASVVSTASFAGAQAPAPGAQAGRSAMGRGMQGGRGERGLFRGIKLSDTEKAKVKDIRAKYAPEQKQLRESLKPAMQEVRAARQKGDSVAAKAAFDRTKDGRDKMKALMDRERAEIRSALTPENQKQFDLNVQERAARRAEWAKNGGKREGHRGHGQRGANG
jgi:Spy/CpxP family protein refolding chaperone